MKANDSNQNRQGASLLARFTASLLVAACLAGCGRNLHGTYTGDSFQGPVTVEFRAGNKALRSAMGQTSQITYTVDGDKVIFDTGTGKQVYTIQKDGSLSSGAGLLSVTLTKK